MGCGGVGVWGCGGVVVGVRDVGRMFADVALVCRIYSRLSKSTNISNNFFLILK